MWKARLPTTSEHLRYPLRRRVAGEAGRRRSERWEGPPPLDFGHSRMWGARQIWLQPRQRYLSRLARMRSISTCTSLSQVSVARPAPSPIFCSSLRAQGKGQLRTLEQVVSQELVWSPLSPLFLAGSQVCALRSRGATVRCSLRVWGDNKRRRVDGGSQTRRRHGESALIRVPIHLRGLTKMTSQFATLYDIYKKAEKIYSVQRMPLIREGLKQKESYCFNFTLSKEVST